MKSVNNIVINPSVVSQEEYDQTIAKFQNIIDQARKKVVTALIEKQAITVGGGHYTRNICKFHCCDCGTEMLATYEENGPVCPGCGSTNVVCSKRQCCESFCEK